MSFEDAMSTDTVVATADLVGRCGARDFGLGWLHEDVPFEEAGWYAHAQFQGVRITVEDRRSPTEAALALAEKLMSSAACRCGEPVTLADGRPGCRWRLMGARWEAGCNAEPIRIRGGRGDLAAMAQALNERIQQQQDTQPPAMRVEPNRAARRRKARRGRGKRR